MSLIQKHEAAYFGQAADWFKQAYLHHFYRTLNDNLPSGVTRVGQLANLHDSVDLIIEKCTNVRNIGEGELADDLIPCLKRILVAKRRREANIAEAQTQRTHNQLVIEEIEKDLREIDNLLQLPWLKEAEPLKMPQVSDFLSIEVIERGAQRHQLEDREFDEKFHILQAPKLMLKDLHYYREVCELRGVPVVVAYLDIDDFKRFNTRYGETEIDRRVLPIFMRTVEAQLFQHGFGYRYGGDEYMLILPNLSRALAISFLQSLATNISATKFHAIDDRITVSIGFCCIYTGCALTDREIENMANQAKSFAKAAGKNRLATYLDDNFHEEALYIVE